MHPRNFGSERIVRTYYDVQKSVLHVQIRPIDLSITYNQPRVTSGYERFAWVFGTFDKITLRFAMNMPFWFCPGMGHPTPRGFFRSSFSRSSFSRSSFSRSSFSRSSFSRSSFSRHPEVTPILAYLLYAVELSAIIKADKIKSFFTIHKQNKPKHYSSTHIHTQTQNFTSNQAQSGCRLSNYSELC